MEWLISAPLACAAGALFYVLAAGFAYAVDSRLGSIQASPSLVAWMVAIIATLEGLVFYAARVVGLQLAGSLDVVRVAGGFTLWLAFAFGVAAAAYAERRFRTRRDNAYSSR